MAQERVERVGERRWALLESRPATAMTWEEAGKEVWRICWRLKIERSVSTISNVDEACREIPGAASGAAVKLYAGVEARPGCSVCADTQS